MPVEIEGEIFLTADETTKAIGISRETLNRYVKQGLIPKFKKGLSRTTYFKKDDIDELIRQRSTMRETKN